MRTMKKKAYWWLAVNQSSVLISPIASAKVSIHPRPQALFGFESKTEAADTQKFLLNCKPEEIEPFMLNLLDRVSREEIVAFPVSNPEPPKNETVWNFSK
jgi:hypothetical protein